MGRLRLGRQRSRSGKWAGESWDQPWVHLPGGDPDWEGGTFRERVQKGWEKERPTQFKSSVKPVTPESKPCHKRCCEITRNRVAICLPEAGQDLDYQRGGDWLSTPNPWFIFSQKNSFRNSHWPQQGRTLGQSHHSRFPYSLLSPKGGNFMEKGIPASPPPQPDQEEPPRSCLGHFHMKADPTGPLQHSWELF